MAHQDADKVQRYEERRKAQGEKPIRVWVPNNEEARRRMRDFAASLCKEARAAKEKTA